MLREIKRRYPDHIPLLSAREDMEVGGEGGEEVSKLQRKIEAVQSRLSEERLKDEEVKAACSVRGGIKGVCISMPTPGNGDVMFTR